MSLWVFVILGLVFGLLGFLADQFKVKQGVFIQLALIIGLCAFFVTLPLGPWALLLLISNLACFGIGNFVPGIF